MMHDSFCINLNKTLTPIANLFASYSTAIIININIYNIWCIKQYAKNRI